MIAQLRPYALGLVGIAIITFPFLWLRLAPVFDTNTVGVTWAPDHARQFFSDLSLVFVLALLIWLGIRANCFFGWDQALARNPSWQKAGHIWAHYWAWLAVPLLFLVVPLSIRTDAMRAAGTLPWINTSTLGLLTMAGLYMLLATGLNITVGMTGLLVLGYAGFYAIGAYFFALTQQYFPYFPWWMAAPLAFVLGGGVGYLLGLPCLRLRGDYLAIVTLGFAEAFREMMRNLSFGGESSTTPHGPFVTELMRFFNTGGDKGIVLKESSIFQGFTGLSNSQVSYAITMFALVVTVFLVQRLFHSPVGRAWIAIRENEIAAAAVGVPVVQMKLLAFSLSAAIAAMAGVIYGAKNGFVNPAMCEFQESIMVLAMVILGGLGNSYGALLGAALLYLVPEYLQNLSTTLKGNPGFNANFPAFVRDPLLHLADYRFLLFGAVMVLMMLYRPQGLLGSRRRKTEMLHP